jgi:glutamate dehydrogenase
MAQRLPSLLRGHMRTRLISAAPFALNTPRLRGYAVKPEQQVQLNYAASAGDLKSVKELIKAGAAGNSPAFDKRYALHLAASNGHLDVVKYLVEQGQADVNALDARGGTPLFDALTSKHVPVANYLREKGAIYGRSSSEELSASLITAASAGDVLTIKALLDQGVSPNAADYDRRTALHLASSEGHTDAVKLLLSHGAEAQPRDRWNFTPLQDAIRNGHTQIVEMLGTAGTTIEKFHQFMDSERSRLALKQILDTSVGTEFQYGCVWRVTPNSELRRTDVWYAGGSSDTEQISLVNYHQHAMRTDSKRSLVADATRSGAPIYQDNPTSEAVASPGVAHNFKSALFVPIKVEGKVVLVYGLFSLNSVANALEKGARIQANSAFLLSTFSGSDQSGTLFSEQMADVYTLVAKAEFFTEGVMRSKVDFFYNQLGLDPYYFHVHKANEVAQHLLAYLTASIHAQSMGQPESLQYVYETPNGALYICAESKRGVFEERILRNYLGESVSGERAENFGARAPSVKCFFSKNPIAPGSNDRVCLFHVKNYPFVNPTPNPEETNVWQLSTTSFLQDRTEQTITRYESCVRSAVKSMGPVCEFTDRGDSSVITFAFKSNSTDGMLNGATHVFRQAGIPLAKFYYEPFSNGYSVYSYHLAGKYDRRTLESVRDSVFWLWLLPKSELHSLFYQQKLTLPEVAYSYAGWKFAYHFMSRSSEEFDVLWNSLSTDPIARSRLISLKKSVRNEMANEPRLVDAIVSHPALVREIYKDFEAAHRVGLSSRPAFNEALWNNIRHEVSDETNLQVMRSMLVFNSHLLKTNFFKQNKAAISFRFDPKFLQDYPVTPFGLFFMIGSEFRGFHLRFDDVARGGVRLIKSRDGQHWQTNAETLFDENYNLAFTQQKKNKDIPEGGSKGTILLSPKNQRAIHTSFHKWVDALMDLLLPEGIVDYYANGQPEIIFLGPDENTADVMDWACTYARKRGYPYWRAITTGKSANLGGIPHDVYGMTTRSVHQYVVGIMKKLNIDESKTVKFQTGGPDGDLGSNEIFISSDITKAIVDGSGVVYDPKGLNREELTRLAHMRVMVEKFDRSKLSKDGWLVLVTDKDKPLPDGSVVESGLNLRNNFHLDPRAAADLFVPCGGRPAAVNVNNVHQIIDNGVPRFKYIVEGANLFFTQEARLKLEEHGAVVFKDATANKGGVTSSSGEVLAALTLTDDEFREHMRVTDAYTPEFYKRYVVDVQNRIETNARLEFECIWREAERTKKPKSIISDQISDRINDLNNRIKDSDLWNDSKLVRSVLQEVLPKTLQELLGIDAIISRLPKSYVNATLSAFFASRFVYSTGLNPDEFSFFKFMQEQKMKH